MTRVIQCAAAVISGASCCATIVFSIDYKNIGRRPFNFNSDRPLIDSGQHLEAAHFSKWFKSLFNFKNFIFSSGPSEMMTV